MIHLVDQIFVLGPTYMHHMYLNRRILTSMPSGCQNFPCLLRLHRVCAAATPTTSTPSPCLGPHRPSKKCIVPPLLRRWDHAANSPVASTVITAAPENRTVHSVVTPSGPHHPAVTATGSTPPRPPPPTTVQQILSLSLSLY
jgi:hypothetical protein